MFVWVQNRHALWPVVSSSLQLRWFVHLQIQDMEGGFVGYRETVYFKKSFKVVVMQLQPRALWWNAMNSEIKVTWTEGENSELLNMPAFRPALHQNVASHAPLTARNFACLPLPLLCPPALHTHTHTHLHPHTRIHTHTYAKKTQYVTSDIH